MKWKDIHYNVKSSTLAFAIGIGGLIYLKSLPEPPRKPYNPLEVSAPTYKLIDADRDGNVDIIERKDGGMLVAQGMENWLRENIPGATFISMCPRISPQLQEAANKRLQGDDSGTFEKLLDKTIKK